MSGSLKNEMKQIKGYPLYLGCILITSLVAEILYFFYILLISSLERAADNNAASPIIPLIRICVLLAVNWGVALFLRDILKEKLRKKINNVLKQKWMEQVFLKKGEALEKLGSGSFQFAFWKLGACVNYFYKMITIYISATMMAAMAVYIIVAMSYKFLLFIVGLILLMFVSQILSGPLENKRMRVNNVEKKNIMLMNNMFKGIDVIKNYGMEKQIHSMFVKNLEEIAQKQRDEKKYELLIYVYNQFVRCLIMIAIPGVTAFFVRKEWVDESTVVLSSFVFFYFFGHIRAIMDNAAKIKQDKGDLKMIEEALTLPQRYQDQGETISLPVCVENLSAAYEDKIIFENKTMNIPPNGVIIIKGESGKGKSTFIKCLMGYKDPAGGYLRTDRGKTEIGTLSTISSYAPQEPILLPISPYDNIKMGKKEAADADVERVLNEICPDLIPVFERCMDAQKLSGGQRQLIGLARTILSDAKVLVWDEPTSALNEAMIRQIISFISKASDERVFIIASHDNAFLGGEYSTYEI